MKPENIEEFKTQASAFARGLRPRAQGATIVALSGELGAGKTTFVQAVAKEFGVEEHVASPTFVIEKIYQLPIIKDRPLYFRHLIHIDAYRLKGAHELEVLGWRELIAEPKNLIFIEWPENIGDALPASAARVTFEGSGDNRTITYGETN